MAATASTIGATRNPGSSTSVGATTARTPGTADNAAAVSAYPLRILLFSNGPTVASATAWASASSSPCPFGRNSSPGLVQNCPAPSVNEPTKPRMTSVPRDAIAPGVMTAGFSEPSSP